MPLINRPTHITHILHDTRSSMMSAISAYHSKQFVGAKHRISSGKCRMIPTCYKKVFVYDFSLFHFGEIFRFSPGIPGHIGQNLTPLDLLPQQRVLRCRGHHFPSTSEQRGFSLTSTETTKNFEKIIAAGSFWQS